MTYPTLKRYILCQYVPVHAKKSDKIPLNPHTLKAHNPLDYSIHMTYEEATAKAWALGESYGIGFVIMPEDNYFFIDIDNCITPDNQWNETALSAINTFPHAYIEVSHSGRGLHIIGRYHCAMPSHSCRNSQLGLEIYTSGRFCALTGTNAVGNAQTFCTEGLLKFIHDMKMDKKTVITPDLEWTTESDPKYNVPEDNLKLIEFLLTKPLTHHEVFGDVLSIRDLWENNISVLALKFPTQTIGKEYDYSAADSALAYRLHYFTGGNCERVLELMKLSKLNRDKWESSPNYLPRTILNARGIRRSTTLMHATHRR